MPPVREVRRRAWPGIALFVLLIGVGSLGVGYWLAKRTRSDQPGISGRGLVWIPPPRQPKSQIRQSVPKLKDQGSRMVELVPGRPGYDPVALAPFVPPEQVFASEPRNSAWANAVEPALLKYDKRAATAVLPGFSIASVECRTTLCRLKWTAPEKTAPLVREVMHHLFPGALMKAKRNGEYYWVLSVARDSTRISCPVMQRPRLPQSQGTAESVLRRSSFAGAAASTSHPRLWPHGPRTRRLEKGPPRPGASGCPVTGLAGYRLGAKQNVPVTPLSATANQPRNKMMTVRSSASLASNEGSGLRPGIPPPCRPRSNCRGWGRWTSGW